MKGYPLWRIPFGISVGVIASSALSAEPEWLALLLLCIALLGAYIFGATFPKEWDK